MTYVDYDNIRAKHAFVREHFGCHTVESKDAWYAIREAINVPRGTTLSQCVSSYGRPLSPEDWAAVDRALDPWRVAVRLAQE